MTRKAFAILLFSFLLFGCINPDEVEVTGKQVVVLPTGTILEASAPINVSRGLEAMIPSVGEPEIIEERVFQIEIGIQSPNKDYQDTKAVLSYNSEHIEAMYAYSLSGEPLEYVGNNTYLFDRDLRAGSETTIYLRGRAKKLPKDTEYLGVEYGVTLIDGVGNTIGGNKESIRMVRANSNMLNILPDIPQPMEEE